MECEHQKDVLAEFAVRKIQPKSNCGRVIGWDRRGNRYGQSQFYRQSVRVGCSDPEWVVVDQVKRKNINNKGPEPGCLSQAENFSLKIRSCRENIFQKPFSSNYSSGDVHCSFEKPAEIYFIKTTKIVHSMFEDNKKFNSKKIFLDFLFLLTHILPSWLSSLKNYTKKSETFFALSEKNKNWSFSEKIFVSLKCSNEHVECSFYNPSKRFTPNGRKFFDRYQKFIEKNFLKVGFCQLRHLDKKIVILTKSLQQKAEFFSLNVRRW